MLFRSIKKEENYEKAIYMYTAHSVYDAYPVADNGTGEWVGVRQCPA